MPKFQIKKELGQNFLVDEKTVEKLVLELDASPSEPIIEIGPGLGAVTKKLLEIYPKNKIYAVEVDPEAVEQLNNIVSSKNCQIIFADALNWLENVNIDQSFKIIGSLPYYITSPILHTIIKMKKTPVSCALLIQHEVAEKICELAPNASYLSTFINTFFETKYVHKVPSQHFEPQPSVDSAILKMTKNKSEFISKKDINSYEIFLHRGFQHPRKMINKVFTIQELEKVNLDGNLRPQEIGVETWIDMFEKLVIR